MYNKEKGIYPPGIYKVGEDIELGGYILTSKEGTISLYDTYEQLKEEDTLNYFSFDDEYHLSLRESGQYIQIDNADIRKV